MLFTSYKHMEAVHALVAPHLKLPVLKQGEAPRRALLSRFVEEPSVLFATQSFWEGVDVPGAALSMVIIDRLPFAPPNEPLQAARMDAVRDGRLVTAPTWMQHPAFYREVFTCLDGKAGA